MEERWADGKPYPLPVSAGRQSASTASQPFISITRSAVTPPEPSSCNAALLILGQLFIYRLQNQTAQVRNRYRSSVGLIPQLTIYYKNRNISLKILNLY